ncbi:hypothetical protein HBI68_072880 [Parastagonospora nodorum]|nr:hypothetical protein HBI68_072880 [Parastagonospora nodorum]
MTPLEILSQPRSWTIMGSLRHLLPYSVARSTQGKCSQFPNNDERPHNTRDTQPHPHNSKYPMTQTLESTKSPEVSQETLASFVEDGSGNTPLGNPSPNDLDMGQKRLRADSNQSPSGEKAIAYSSNAFRLGLTTISSEQDKGAILVMSTEKSAIATYKEDTEAQNQASGRSVESGVRASRLQRWRLHWLTAYRVLVAITLVINALILGLLIKLELPRPNVLVATAANLLISILVRQEDLINLSFGLIARIPSSTPLGLRKVIADFHHYGGIHIGCAVSALLWYCVFVYANTRSCITAAQYGGMTNWHWADIITCYVFLVFIAAMCLTAIPHLREKIHNQFERIHRFGGWLSLAVLWINAGITTIIEPSHTPLYKSKSIWLLTAATLVIILPWLRIRRVAITAQSISSREVKLTFPFTNMPYTSTCRFSLSPVIEWHAFATIPSPDGLSAHIIISAAGDWTKRIISAPPSTIWIRNPPAANFLAFSPVFNSLLLVATGAGIGPMLSLLSSPAIARMRSQGRVVRVMWCVYDPNAPHWEFVQDMIRAVDPAPRIFDSRTGRPDMAFEARDLAEKENIEAVMVVSNKKVTNQVVAEVKGHGGAAYGAVFDS